MNRNTRIADFRNALHKKIKEAILRYPDKTFDVIAAELQVTRSYVGNVARDLQRETGFKRANGPRNKKTQVNSPAIKGLV
jgi:hypothetical protein